MAKDCSVDTWRYAVDANRFALSETVRDASLPVSSDAVTVFTVGSSPRVVKDVAAPVTAPNVLVATRRT